MEETKTNLKTVFIYTTRNDEPMEYVMDTGEMCELLEQLKTLSFIRVWELYINKMHITWIWFDSWELLKQLQDFSLGRA